MNIPDKVNLTPIESMTTINPETGETVDVFPGLDMSKFLAEELPDGKFRIYAPDGSYMDLTPGEDFV
jgi:hypothetical protein